MELAVDANIIISALISENGKTRDLIFLTKLSLFAPEFLLKEVEKYKELIIKKSGLNKESFEIAKSLIFSKIKLIPLFEFENFLPKAKEICPDEYDEEYFALAFKFNCPIWSNDKKLKEQNKVKVYNTIELINLLK